MLRHSVIWLLRDTTTPQQRIEMLKGLAFLRMECPMVKAGDYGEDIFGGSRTLQEVRPFDRTPIWRREGDGPPSNYDVALHLDFDDWDGHEEYSADQTHAHMSRFNEAASWDELTARVDWYYDGEPPTRHRHVKHVAMFVWADDANESARQRAIDAVQTLVEVPEVESVAVGHNVGTLQSDYDWIMDVQIPDRSSTERLLAGERYAAAMADVAAATKYEWTARLSHMMRRS